MRKPKYDLFLSYNPLDAEAVQLLASKLTHAGVSVWFDRWGLVPGQNWEFSIERAMADSAAIGICIGPMGVERWPEKDISLARSIQQVNPSLNIIPILLPGSKHSDMPPVLNSLTYLNFQEGNVDPHIISRLKDVIRETPQVATVKTPRERELPITNIPRPPVIGFVTRRDSQGRDLLERLKGELALEKNQLIALSGLGGVGKTTLAAEVARSLSKSVGQRIVWTSAVVRYDYSLSTLLDEIATQMGREDLRQLVSEQKAGAVAKMLVEERPLIVLDNFETIAQEEQVRCVDFLSTRTTCRTLITTRQKIDSVRNITVPAMDSLEAQEFLNRLIGEASDPAAFAQLDLERVRQVSEGNPLVMQWMVGQIDLARDPQAVLDDLSHGAGDAAQRVFGHSFELGALGDDGRVVLMALSMFVPDASREALADVAGFPGDVNRLKEAVRRLASLYLVKSDPGSRLSVIGLTREFAKRLLYKDEQAKEYRNRFVSYFLKYAEVHAEPKAENYDALEREKDNLLNSMDVAFESADWRIVVRFMDVLSLDGVSGFLPMRGYLEEAERQGERALEAARSLSNEALVARFSHNLAITFQNRGELEKARRLYHESLEINKKLGNQSGIAITMHELGILAQGQGELGEARRLYDESLEIQKKLGSQSGIAITLHNVAALAQAQGELAEARRLYHESLEITKKLGDQNGIASTLHELGRLAQDQGKLTEARRLYHESLEINKKLGNQSGVASTLHQLATLAQDQGEFAEAGRLYDESLEIVRKLGHQSGIAITLHQLGRLTEDDANFDEAATLFREAFEIFEKLGSPNAEIARQSLARVEGKSS